MGQPSRGEHNITDVYMDTQAICRHKDVSPSLRVLDSTLTYSCEAVPQDNGCGTVFLIIVDMQNQVPKRFVSMTMQFCPSRRYLVLSCILAFV